MYNETTIGGVVSAVQPTPAIGGVGILKDVEKRAGGAFTEHGLHVLLIGKTVGHLGSSLYLREVLSREDGAPPPVNLNHEHDFGNFVRELIHTNRIDACHDISDGGLLVALAEMCMPKNIGASITFPDHIPAHAFAFGEDQARYIIACKAEHADEIVEQAAAKNIPITTLGKTEGDMLEVSGLLNVAVSAIKTINAAWMPKYMA